MAERKNLTITQVEEVKKVGENNIPKLSFRVEGQEERHSYFTFRPRLFELIKEGQIIEADIETSVHGDYTNHKVTQIYKDGQPAIGRGRSYGKSPEELEQQARVMVLSYAKDLAVAQLIPGENITKQADIFYAWLKGNGNKPTPPAKKSQSQKKTAEEQEFENLDKSEPTEHQSTPTGKKVQNIAELKGLLMKHKIATHEAYEILSIKSFMDLVYLDEAWAKIKEAKGIE